MIVLSISKLNNNFSAGTNINIPKFVKYLNKNCTSGYLDCGNEELLNFREYNNYFKLSRYQKICNLPKPFNKPDIIVFQDFYNIESIKLLHEITKMNIPYTIVPRSAMTKEAQKSKKIKKYIGNVLFFNKFVKNAKFIHFLTENEYLESKKSFKFKDFVIIGNGIEMPNKKYEIKARSEFIITFIGRYNIYHKGLDILFECINDNYYWFNENKVKFVLYGFNSAGGYDYLKKYVEEKNLQNIISLNGTIFGKDKENVLLDSDVFIHTSRLEGHPTSVIEAISYGIPVIVTPGTNFLDEVKKYNLGFVSELNSKDIFQCIKKAYENKDRFQIISTNEIKYAKDNFDWQIIAKKVIDEYKKEL